MIVNSTLQGTNISPQNIILKMILLFPRWDMLIPWRVPLFACSRIWIPLTFEQNFFQGFSERLGNVSGEIGSALAFSQQKKSNGENMGLGGCPGGVTGKMEQKHGVTHIIGEKKRAKCSEMDCFLFWRGGRWKRMKKGEGNRKSCCVRLFVLDLKGRKMPIES